MPFPKNVNDWGLPDYLDPAAYGDVDNWSEAQWRWEFTRRREDYRADFDAAAIETVEHLRTEANRAGDDFGKYLSPDHRDFVAQGNSKKLFEKYGLVSLPNPHFSKHVISAPWFPQSLGPVGVWTGRGADIWAEDVEQVRLPKGFSAIVVDLSKSIKPQIDRMMKRLLDKQKKEIGKVEARRKHQSTWFRYLRVLDGRAAGASWSDLEEIAASNGDVQSPQNAKQVWDAARVLMLNWPS